MSDAISFFAEVADIVGAVAVMIALWFAYGATAAARAAVNATLDTGKAQTRAYLTVTGATYFARENRFEISVPIRNAGNSPASNISLTGKILWRNVYRLNIGEAVSTGGELVATDMERYFVSDIPPGSIGHGGFTLPSDKEIAARIYRKAQSPVRIRCALKWDDVFGESQEIRFELLGFRYDESEDNERGHKGKLRIEWQWGSNPDDFSPDEEAKKALSS